MSHTVSEAVRDYLKLRQQISDVNAESKQRVATYKRTQGIITDFLEQQRVAQGVESFRTEHGTAFRHHWDAVKVVNWDQFLAWLIATGNWSMLTKAVSKDVVIDFMRETNTIPPGLEYDHGYEIRVRKGNK